MKINSTFVFLLVHFHDEKGVNRPGWEKINEEAAMNYTPLNLMLPHAGGLLRSEASDIENDIDIRVLTEEGRLKYCNRYAALKNGCPAFAIMDSSEQDIWLQPIIVSQNGDYLYHNSLLVLPIDLYEYDDIESLERTVWGMKGIDYEFRLQQTDTQGEVRMNCFNTFLQCLLSDINDTDDVNLSYIEAPEASFSFKTIAYSTIISGEGEKIQTEDMEKLCFAGSGKNLNKAASLTSFYDDMGIDDMILCENTFGKAFIQQGQSVYNSICSHGVDVEIRRGETINLYLELMVETQKNSLMNMLCAIQSIDLNNNGEESTNDIRETLRNLIQTRVNSQFFTISDQIDNINNYYSHLCQSYQLAPLYEEAEKKIAMINTFLGQVHEANNELADQQQNRQNWFLSIVLAILTVTSASNDILEFSTKVETLESGSVWYVWGGRLFFILTIAIIAFLIHRVVATTASRSSKRPNKKK